MSSRGNLPQSASLADMATANVSAAAEVATDGSQEKEDTQTPYVLSAEVECEAIITTLRWQAEQQLKQAINKGNDEDMVNARQQVILYVVRRKQFDHCLC